MVRKAQRTTTVTMVESDTKAEILDEKSLAETGRRLVLERVSEGRNGVRLVLCRENEDGSLNWDVQSVFAGIYADAVDESDCSKLFSQIDSVTNFHDLSNSTRDKIKKSVSKG
ncbi:hypothetical protein KAR91_04425 [Candidatus Pacearchaeota archaeon]|nr:hypothetical protein [Candidatus Pacearchaeota archaeon]